MKKTNVALHSFNVLSLCSGVGGFELGLRLASVPHRVVCYVEGEAYCVGVLRARMEEGLLDEAPVWSDIRTFVARPWCEAVDLVTAGFPCQPFSSAGKKRGTDDPRHIWPSIARIIRECEPRAVFLENVQREAFREPWRDLQEMGFEVPPLVCVSAAELGAAHQRRRYFLLAYADSGWKSTLREHAQAFGVQEVAGSASWAREPAPEVLGMDDGVPYRVDRERALGNAVIPCVVARAWDILIAQL